MKHAACNGLLVLVVISLNLALGYLGHQLKVHEAAVRVGVSLGSHQCHGLLVLVERLAGRFVISMHRTLLDLLLVKIHTVVEALKILLIVKLVVLLAVRIA